MKIISVRENPQCLDEAIAYFQQCWPSVMPEIYEDCITHSIDARDSLSQWYLLEKEGEIIGCAGLITNDFISRGDLYPWGETSRVYEIALEWKREGLSTYIPSPE